MNLIEINKDKTPKLFHAGLDDDGMWTETLDVSPSETDIRLRSACKHRSGKPLIAYQEMRLTNGKMQLWYIEPGIELIENELSSYPDWTETLAAEGYVIQENETSLDFWETYQFTNFKTEKADKDKTKSKVNKGELLVEDEEASIDVDITWKNKDKKQLYTFKHKTSKLRGRATIKLLEPELVTFNYDDYIGETIENQYEIDGIQFVDILFEPDGVVGELVVDPYLEIDEQATYIDVTCDGYNLQIHDGSVDNNFCQFHIGSDYARFIGRCTTGGGVKYFNGGIDSVLTILINKETIIKISQKGNIYTQAGSTSLEYIYSIYSDRISVEVVWVVGSTITLLDSDNNGLFSLFSGSGITFDNIAGNASSEIDAVNSTDYTTYNYLGCESTQVDIIGITTVEEHTGDSSFKVFTRSDQLTAFWAWNDGTLLAGTHRFTVEFIIDSADRENGSQLYNSSDRLEQGIQYTNPSELTFTTGSAVTSGKGHTSIGTDGFASDGAYHVDPAGTDGDEVNLDVGQIEHKTNIVIHDFPYTSGDGAVDYLDEKFNTFDANAANSTVTADIGNNANWEAVSDGSDRNTNTSGDSVSTDYGTGLDTQNGAAYIDMALGNYLNTFFIKGSLLIRCQPQFTYNDAADQTLWHCYVDANNYLLLFYDAGTDQFHFTVVWGHTSITVTSSAYTADDELQLYKLIQINWDSTTNKIELNINGQVIDSDTNTGTPSSSNPTKVTMGAMQDRSLPGDFILISALSFDTPILSYGGYFTGNTAAQLTTGMYHKDITGCISCRQITGEYTEIPNDDSVAVTIVNMTNEDGFMGADTCLRSTGIGTSADRISFPSNGIVNGSQGRIGFWYKWNSTAGSSYASVMGHSSGANAFRIRLISGTSITLHSPDGAVSDSVTVQDYWDGVWHYMEYIYDTNADLLVIKIDGVLCTDITPPTMSALDTSTGNMIFGNFGSLNRDCGGDICQIFISDNPNTPQIPTAKGVPLDFPIVRND